MLSVGQCRPDQAAISHFLTANFGVQVQTADVANEALAAARQQPVQLVLVNRILDADGSDGLAIIDALQADAATRDIPVMLVSNHDDWQQRAVARGARPGFGKAQLRQPLARDRVAAALGVGSSAADSD